ncbi:uncharacterized protein LOC121889230 isoform X2 [Thunnus maccoyii]|uniref:uncharacterized protein LOC121889230 isoform X2 n=1 Tax=Thunnus maccoyii TaxID=8240 RepID=UPI001C4C36FC|nr:uncharacterized protein LOC121889230 isoform X2 [Thunnus maccoyii]
MTHLFDKGNTWIDKTAAAYCKSHSYKPRRKLSIMLDTFPFCSRLLSVLVLVCAAVMSFIMSSDAARVSPITVQVENGVKHITLRSLYTPYSQNNLLSTGPLSTETGLPTASKSETGTSWKLSDKGPLSIIDHQSKPLLLTESSFSYNRNLPHNKQSQARITGLQRGHNTGDVRPASSIFTSHSQHRGQSSRVNYHPLSHKVVQTGSPYHLSPAIIRKSAHIEAAGPFHQRSSLLQSWDPKDAQKSYDEGKVIRSDSPRAAGEDKTVWQSSESSLFSSQTGRYRSGSLPTSRGHYGGYKETNERAVAGAWSGGIQSSKFHSFATQTAPRAPSVSKSLDTPVIKRNPSPEKLPSSVTDFSQGLYSISSSETPRHKKLISSSATSNTQRDVRVYSRLPSNFKQQSHRKDPNKEEQHFSDNTNTKVAQYGGQTDSFTKYQPISSIYLPLHTTAQTPARGPLTMESFVPVPLEDFQDNYATGSEKSVVSSLVNMTARGSAHGYKPGRSTKSIYGFRGFKKIDKKILSSSGTDGKADSQRYSFDKGKDYTVKITNIYPSLSQKYSFGQRRTSSMTTTPNPAKTERTTTEFSGPGNTSPSPSRLDVLQTTTVSTPTLFTSGFSEVWPLVPESNAGMDSNPDRRQFRGYKRVYGLKGFGTRPLSTTTFNQVEGAKPSVRESDKSAVLPGFEDFKLSNAQMWQRSRIHRWHNQTVESDVTATHRGNELSGEDLKPLLKTSGSTESAPRFTPDKYKKNHKIYTFQGFQSIQNRIGNAHNKPQWNHQTKQNPTPRVSSAYLRSAGDPMKPVAIKTSLLNSSTSSTVRGKRVKGKHTNGKKLNDSTSLTNDTGYVAIVRLPKRPARVKAVTYADILGSASFSGVRATTQTPITAADKDFFPYTTAATKQKGGTLSDDRLWAVDESMAEKDQTNSEGSVHSRENTKAPAEGEVEDFSSVEESKLGVRKKVDSEVKTSNLFLDTEGSGSAAFDLSDILSTASTGSQALDEDLLELDYLRISTGNISFKSMKLSRSDK